MDSVRILQPGDEAVLERYLRSCRDTSMFLRSNVARAGLEDHGQRFQGTYAAAFEGPAIVGVVGHAWNGMLMAAAPRGLALLANTVLRASGRAVHGFSGPAEQVDALRAHCALQDAEARLHTAEVLFAVDLDALQVPAALADGCVRCRRAEAGDDAVLGPWVRDYFVETLGAEAGPELDRDVAEGLQSGRDLGTLWVLEAAGRPVSMTRFNATMPDCVQVGGVYTPPALRARGHARCAVAGSLLEARAAGVERSILFTAGDNVAAQACYRGLGYEEIGAFGLVILREGHRVPRAHAG